MGSWMVHIAGHGIHDNGLEGDVDRMLTDFVAKLRAAGHYIEAAHLTIGAGRALTKESDGTDSVKTF